MLDAMSRIIRHRASKKKVSVPSQRYPSAECHGGLGRSIPEPVRVRRPPNQPRDLFRVQQFTRLPLASAASFPRRVLRQIRKVKSNCNVFGQLLLKG